ncbi:LapD/MoxY N-terminal periplasmic domain-containing protein [Achromobacter spanius]|uniref:LapD/MoxY N-terminal periplasmic domain-containing protein n=1 Tax=Achromobacter spanius TaxID=217203 RepID=UPI001F0BD978|nr:LapD/MoxY N-terminal periplasmic domain-containing protein [Achromobacter spanius]
MSTLRRLLLCTALLVGFILLGAQALGMLAAHRYLNAQLAQQSEGGASALTWALAHASSSPEERAALADELFEQGLYALVRITNDNDATIIERSKQPSGAHPTGDWRTAWLNVQAPRYHARMCHWTAAHAAP